MTTLPVQVMYTIPFSDIHEPGSLEMDREIGGEEPRGIFVSGMTNPGASRANATDDMEFLTTMFVKRAGQQHKNMVEILVVDDYEDIREILTNFLTDHGYKVITASSLSEAARILDIYSVKLVIADLRLPDGSGAILVQQAEAKGIPWLLISGDHESLQQHDTARGRSLPKPFRLSLLLDAVRGYLSCLTLITHKQ